MEGWIVRLDWMAIDVPKDSGLHSFPTLGGLRPRSIASKARFEANSATDWGARHNFVIGMLRILISTSQACLRMVANLTRGPYRRLRSTSMVPQFLLTSER